MNNNWERPAQCGDNACVEVRTLEHQGKLVWIEVRQSNYTDPEGVLRFSPQEWADFITAGKAGQYDL